MAGKKANMQYDTKAMIDSKSNKYVSMRKPFCVFFLFFVWFLTKKKKKKYEPIGSTCLGNLKQAMYALNKIAKINGVPTT